MASAFPSRGVGDPAARSTVRSPVAAMLAASAQAARLAAALQSRSENKPAAVAAEHPLAQLHPRCLTRPHCEQVLVDGNQRSQTTSSVAVPSRFVAELPGQFGPGGVTDGAGKLSVAKQVGDGEVFQAKPIVGLDELAGDLVQKAPAPVGNAGVLSGQPPDGLGVVGGSGLGARCRTRPCPQAHACCAGAAWAASKRPTSVLVAVAATANAESPRSTPTNPAWSLARRDGWRR